MKYIGKTIQIVILSVLFCVITSENTQANDDFPLSISAILPENQINKNVGYYDLKMEPNQEQILDLEISNLTKETKKIKAEINNATTNDVGVIDYSNKEDDFKKDDSLKLSLEDIAAVNKSMTIKPFSKETIKIKLKMPENNFKGIIVGAVRIFEEEDTGDKKADSDLQMRNRTVYTTGINLRESETKIDAELNLIKAFADQENGNNYVKINIQNNQPVVLENITYSAEVFEKGNSKPLHQQNESNYRFAPQSNFNFKVDWENEPFKAGKYVVHMVAQSKDTQQKWEWNQDFEITKEEADKFNKTNQNIKEKKNYTYIYVGVFIAILLIATIWFLYVKFRKQK
ncbi:MULTISPECIES: DUF916 and DUF3324 domain-containing protein [Vagococcus]|uniref:Cell surface protein n=1 Tax=Vagococcus fluvialis bH819 TaxID=1255619 RepID=A0A1X6WM37_9ENTE|nr:MULTISPECIES: DUF916 and DUF3324 domain-containing protein [Vagococcus]SLM85335.1 cell surface protein precursor [Vagococcus fluvialis bH819]HCM89371.1 DUF916 and DUF3324 domain-containing protein [Vagococcus sp.]